MSASMSARNDVLAAEDVALADPPALERGEMAGGDVVDMDEVEPGVDEGGHAPRRRLDDDAAGRRRPHVARADRRRRIDDHGRQPVAPDHRLDQALRRDLAALVGADRLAFGERTSSVAERAVGELQGRDAAGVDDALDAGAQRLLHDEARSLDIVADDLVGVSRPQPIVGGGVKEKRTPFSAAASEARSRRSPSHNSVARIEMLARGLEGRTSTRTRCPPARSAAGDRRADETARAGDERSG